MRVGEGVSIVVPRNGEKGKVKERRRREEGRTNSKDNAYASESSANQRKSKKKLTPPPCMPHSLPSSPASPPPSNRGISLADECRSVTRLVGCTVAMSDANSVFYGC
jgi:hypothetical protein